MIANARLIAASPNLLDVCRSVVAWDDLHLPDGKLPGWLEIVQSARAALAKADSGR